MHKLTCGVDEAGRGPLAGPVVAAAVILGAEHGIEGIADSKKLSAKRREELADLIRQHALAWSVSSASVDEIDQLNIFRATLLAMRRAVLGLSMSPGLVLVDGTHCPELPMPARPVIRGDSTVEVIAAASILAKTARDGELTALHARYPQYNFGRHKGYPTAEHVRLLELHGPCSEHRRSFGPVRRAEGLAGKPVVLK